MELLVTPNVTAATDPGEKKDLLSRSTSRITARARPLGSFAVRAVFKVDIQLLAE